MGISNWLRRSRAGLKSPFVAVVLTALFLLGMGRVPAEQVPKVAIETQDGATHVFAVEIADTQRERAKGLMFRREMPLDTGMLFLFPRQQMLSFWMKDTPLPLDIIFIDAKGEVVHIAQNTKPFSLSPISSQLPAASALEVNAGRTDALNITIGDVVRHPFFKNVEDAPVPVEELVE